MNQTELAKRIVAFLLLSLLAVPSVFAADDQEETENKIRFFGKAIFNTHYDTALQPYDFSSYLIDDTEKEFNFNPRDTRLGFVASHKSGEWTYSAVYETDFYGDNNGNSMLPRMRLGYARAENSSGLSITGGQDWIPIAQRNPSCIDFGILSWAGNLWSRVPQVTLRKKYSRGEVLVGIMKHRISNLQESQEIMPWTLARAEVHDLLVAGSRFAVGAGYRSVDVEENAYRPHIEAVEFFVPLISSKLVVSGELYACSGAGREFVHYGFDYNPAHPTGARLISSTGGFIEVSFYYSSKSTVVIGYGGDNPKDDNLIGLDSVPYRKNSLVFVTGKRSITRNFGYGLEVIKYKTDTGERHELHGERVSTSLWYVF